MPFIFYLILYYLLFINLFACIITAVDKYKATHQKWRIPEKVLMLVTILGGSVGMYLTMRIIHHKTRHKKFMIGIPIIFVLQVFLFWLCMQALNQPLFQLS